MVSFHENQTRYVCSTDNVINHHRQCWGEVSKWVYSVINSCKVVSVWTFVNHSCLFSVIIHNEECMDLSAVSPCHGANSTGSTGEGDSGGRTDWYDTILRWWRGRQGETLDTYKKMKIAVCQSRVNSKAHKNYLLLNYYALQDKVWRESFPQHADCIGPQVGCCNNSGSKLIHGGRGVNWNVRKARTLCMTHRGSGINKEWRMVHAYIILKVWKVQAGFWSAALM